MSAIDKSVQHRGASDHRSLHLTAAGFLPVHKSLQQFALAGRQLVDVGHEESVVFQVEQHLAAGAEILRLALGPAHRELGRPLVGPHAEVADSRIPA